MTSYSSLPYTIPHNSPEHDAPRWHPGTRQPYEPHNENSYGPLPHQPLVSVPGYSSPTRSSTAYEPSHLESESTKRNSSEQLSSTRAPISSWILEIFAITISTGAIVSIVALLHRENGRSLSSWKLAVTLNTVVAALGTLARTTLAFALSACIGQQKWNWLRRKPDSLVAWERFDEASRGPWGGTRLFVWLRARLAFYAHLTA